MFCQKINDKYPCDIYFRKVFKTMVNFYWIHSGVGVCGKGALNPMMPLFIIKTPHLFQSMFSFEFNSALPYTHTNFFYKSFFCYGGTLSGIRATKFVPKFKKVTHIFIVLK